MTDYYDELDRAAEPSRMDGWRHPLEQWLRFEVVRRGLGIEPPCSLVDLGCGTGRLYGYLGAAEIEYVGIDRREAVIERGRRDFPDASFRRADLTDPGVQRGGPFDFAVAIGTLVDGDLSGQGREQLRVLIDRLDELGECGWALCVLDQQVIDGDPVRQLEPALKGSTRDQLQRLAGRHGLDPVIVDDALVSDLFAVVHRSDSAPAIRRRLGDDAPCRRVVEQAQGAKEFDAADIAWLWLACGRAAKARAAIEEVPEGHPRRSLLQQQLRLLEG